MDALDTEEFYGFVPFLANFDGGKILINLQKIAFGDLLSSIKLESPWTSSILLATECPF